MERAWATQPGTNKLQGGGWEVSCARSRLFVVPRVVGWLAGTGRPGGRLVTGLSVRCHGPLWRRGIDEEQQQDD